MSWIGGTACAADRVAPSPRTIPETEGGYAMILGNAASHFGPSLAMTLLALTPEPGPPTLPPTPPAPLMTRHHPARGRGGGGPGRGRRRQRSAERGGGRVVDDAERRAQQLGGLGPPGARQARADRGAARGRQEHVSRLVGMRHRHR